MRGLHHRTITPCVLWCCTIAKHAAGSTPRLRVESGHWPEVHELDLLILNKRCGRRTPRLKPVLRAADAQRLPHRYIRGETTSDVSPRDLKNRCSPDEKRGSWAWSRSGRRWRHGSRNILAPPVIDRPERHPFAPFRWAYGVDRCRVGKSTAQDVWQPYGTAICEIHIDFFD